MRKLLSFLDGVTAVQFRALILAGVLAGVIASFSALGLSIYGASNASSAAHNAASAALNIRTLLLNGKTASAISAKKAAHNTQIAKYNTQLLLTLERYNRQTTARDHAQTEKGQRTLTLGEKQMETEIGAHLDNTIRNIVAADNRSGQKQLRTIVAEVERSFDLTIRSAITQATRRVTRKLH